MATAEPLLSQKVITEESLNSSPCDDQTEISSTSMIESDESNWILSLNPKERSCINLTVVEPCVSKASAHLGVLKKALLREKIRGLVQIKLTPRQHSKSVSVPRSSAVPEIRDASDASDHGSRESSSPMMVEGVKTGTYVEKYMSFPSGNKVVELDGREVITSALHLVARLEHDRQETLKLLAEEKLKVKRLRGKLDQEHERRLDMLPKLVQAEHEQCARDIRELQWHINHKQRKLDRLLETERMLKKKNGELMKVVDHLTGIVPEVESKLMIENENIRRIVQEQRETSDELHQAKKAHLDLQERCHKVHLRAEADKKTLERRKEKLVMTLEDMNTEFNIMERACEEVSQMVQDCSDKLISIHSRRKSMEDRAKQTQEEYNELLAILEKMKEKKKLLDRALEVIEARAQKLQETKDTKHEKLENEYSSVLSIMKREERKLRKAKDEYDSVEQEIDELNEAIDIMKKKIIRDEKSIGRANKELVKLEKQADRSTLDCAKTNDDHIKLTEEYKRLKITIDDVEYSLNRKILELQSQIREEKKSKVLYENKIQVKETEALKATADHKRKEEEVKRTLSAMDKQNEELSAKLKDLEETNEGSKLVTEELEKEVTTMTEEQVAVERELGRKAAVLIPKEAQLREEVTEKAKVLYDITDRISHLEKEVENAKKSSATLSKLENNVVAEVESLTAEVIAMENKLNEEQDNDQSWRDEYREISDFSIEADLRHAKYFKERNELLKQNKLDLHKKMHENEEMSKTYHQLQNEYLKLKAEALKVIEIKLQMEASLRDYEQLLAFQSYIYSVMKEYYYKRGVNCRRELCRLDRMGKDNIEVLRAVREQFHAVIALMHKYLDDTPMPSPAAISKSTLASTGSTESTLTATE